MTQMHLSIRQNISLEQQSIYYIDLESARLAMHEASLATVIVHCTAAVTRSL